MEKQRIEIDTRIGKIVVETGSLDYELVRISLNGEAISFTDLCEDKLSTVVYQTTDPSEEGKSFEYNYKGE